jgi:hypothetical protein
LRRPLRRRPSLDQVRSVTGEPRYACVSVGYDCGERLIYFVGNGCRELADCSDPNHASKFGPRYLESLFGAPLFRHLIEKRIVCALQLDGAFFNPCFQLIPGLPKGLFYLLSPRNQTIRD